MANSVSISNDVLSNAALDGFVSVLAPLNAISTNLSPKAGQIGDGVVVNLYGAASTANDFGGDYTANSDSSIGSVTVNLTNHSYKTVHVTDAQRQNQGVDLYKLGFYAGQTVAKTIVTGAYGLLTTGTFGVPAAGQIIGSVSNFATSGVLNARAAAVGWGEKNMVVASDAYSALLGSLPTSTTVQDNSTKEGSIGKLYGFNLFETDLQLVASDSKIKAVAVHPSAVALATRYLAPDDGGSAYMATNVVTDPKSQATLGTREWYDPSAGKHYFTAECLWGASVGVTGAAKIIKTVN